MPRVARKRGLSTRPRSWRSTPSILALFQLAFIELAWAHPKENPMTPSTPLVEPVDARIFRVTWYNYPGNPGPEEHPIAWFQGPDLGLTLEQRLTVAQLAVGQQVSLETLNDSMLVERLENRSTPVRAMHPDAVLIRTLVDYARRFADTHFEPEGSDARTAIDAGLALAQRIDGGDPTPVVVAEVEGGVFHLVHANAPVRLIVLDEDLEGCSGDDPIVVVNQVPRYLRDYRIDPDAAAKAADTVRDVVAALEEVSK